MNRKNMSLKSVIIIVIYKFSNYKIQSLISRTHHCTSTVGAPRQLPKPTKKDLLDPGSKLKVEDWAKIPKTDLIEPFHATPDRD